MVLRSTVSACWRTVSWSWGRGPPSSTGLSFLNRISMCQGLRQSALMSIDGALKWSKVPRGAVLQEAGTPMQGLLLVRSGTLGLYTAPSRWGGGGRPSTLIGPKP